MSEAGRPRPDPSVIGVIPKAQFARLPDPGSLFARRAERFRSLTGGHDLAPYLGFLADLAAAQAAVEAELSAPELPAAEALARAARHAMPPLDRAGFAAGGAFGDALDRLLAASRGIAMPAPARVALDRVAAADDATRDAMVANVLADAVPFEEIAEHALVAAALQVWFARMAAALDGAALTPVGDGACPACGGPPVASLVVDWAGSGGARYCVCSLCSIEWNYVRAKCTLCASTAEISFREVEGGEGRIKAECCGTCRGYVKVLYRQKDPGLDPVADDVASLGLDILVREQGFRRGAVNPFLTGY